MIRRYGRKIPPPLDWGLDGYFWCPLSVLDDQQTDLKIVHSGKPW